MADWTTVVSRAVRGIALADVEKQSDRDLIERFAAHDDQAAFAALVERHGPMVLGVCRRRLAQPQDAEDAAQAVFVLLAQKAKRISWNASIANWLYASARNVAWHAFVSARRRTVREKLAAQAEPVSTLDDITGRELLAILDEELEKLPSRYREPLVLCYLEGMSREEAATRLGVPEATLKSQLERGRKKLGDALASRGCTLSAALLLVATGRGLSSPRFVDSILASLSGSPPRAVAELVRSTTNSAFMKASILVFGVSTLLIGLGLASISLNSTLIRSDKDELKRAATKTDEPRVEAKETSPLMRIGTPRFRADGRIGGARYSPDGKRIVACAGTSLYVWDAKEGNLLRRIETGLELLDDPRMDDDVSLAFAVHPKENWMTCGGVKDGKAHLQTWDIESGKRIAEKPTRHNALKALAWTPEGEHLLERVDQGWHEPAECRLNVRGRDLGEIRSLELSKDFGNSRLLVPLPGGREAFLGRWGAPSAVLDLETGTTVRTLATGSTGTITAGVSADGKTLVVAGRKEVDGNPVDTLALFRLADGEKLRELPVIRAIDRVFGPRFSPDGKTVYVWDRRPMAYDVETGKERWRGVAPTWFGGGMLSQDISPDGSTMLLSVANGLTLLDTRTGVERELAVSPAENSQVRWSPDGKIILTRSASYALERTWTAWDAATGKKLYHVQPGEHFPGDEWKFTEHLFFINGGKEFLACLDKSRPHDRNVFKQLFVFDTATGKVNRLPGEELGETFRWSFPIAANADGSRVVMQMYSPRQGEYKTVLWEPATRSIVGELDWPRSQRFYDPIHHYAPYFAHVRAGYSGGKTLAKNKGGGSEWVDEKPFPATLRCCSLADGKLVREFFSDLAALQLDRVQGHSLLTIAYDRKEVRIGNTIDFTGKPPYVCDLWEIPTGQRARLFEEDRNVDAVLGPGAKYLLRQLGKQGFEVSEPHVLKKTVLTVPTTSPPVWFEFSDDGTRVAVTLADATIAIWDTTPWVKRIDDELRERVPQDLNPLWEDLAKDAATGYRASRLLELADERAVSLLGEKLPAKRVPEEATIARLIRDLDSPEFATRQKAEKELRGLSTQVEASLREAAKTAPSAEVKKRIEEIVKEIESRNLTREECREWRAVRAVKGMASERAKELLAKWAQGDPNATLTKLARE